MVGVEASWWHGLKARKAVEELYTLRDDNSHKGSSALALRNQLRILEEHEGCALMRISRLVGTGRHWAPLSGHEGGAPREEAAASWDAGLFCSELSSEPDVIVPDWPFLFRTTTKPAPTPAHMTASISASI